MRPDPDELARALAAVEHRGQVRTAQSAAAGDLGVARVYELASVARTAMREAAHLTNYERGLCHVVPAAAARVKVIADVAATSFAEIVAGTGRVLVGPAGREHR